MWPFKSDANLLKSAEEQLNLINKTCGFLETILKYAKQCRHGMEPHYYTKSIPDFLCEILRESGSEKEKIGWLTKEDFSIIEEAVKMRFKEIENSLNIIETKGEPPKGLIQRLRKSVRESRKVHKQSHELNAKSKELDSKISKLFERIFKGEVDPILIKPIKN